MPHPPPPEGMPTGAWDGDAQEMQEVGSRRYLRAGRGLGDALWPPARGPAGIWDYGAAPERGFAGSERFWLQTPSRF